MSSEPVAVSENEENAPPRRVSSRKIIRRGSSKEALGGDGEPTPEVEKGVGQSAVTEGDADSRGSGYGNQASSDMHGHSQPESSTGSVKGPVETQNIAAEDETGVPVLGSEGTPVLSSTLSPTEASQMDDDRERGASYASDSDLEDKNDRAENIEKQLTLRAIEEEGRILQRETTSFQQGEEHVNVWPESYSIESELGPDDLPSNLDSEGPEVEQWLREKKKLSIRTVTWNLCARAPPSVEDTRANLLPRNKYHMYVIGTEECERSIAQSALNPSKKVWEKYLSEVLGSNYVPIKAHTLQAIHIMVFAHKSVAHLCSEVSSGAVATGVADTLGNKGGVIVSMLVGKTRFALVNVHLAAHQNKTDRRNLEFGRINREGSVVIDKKSRKMGFDPISSSRNRSTSAGESAVAAANENDDDTMASSATNDASPRANDQETVDRGSGGSSLRDIADRVVFMGDMNYRVRGTRKVVDKLLAHNMHDVMLSNDQLNWSMEQNLIPAEFVEPPLNFRPTYKFDLNSDVYDTGSKGRIPAWCDRILYIKDGLKCVNYDADMSLKTSDHRPVFATFLSDIELDESPPQDQEEASSDSNPPREIPEFISESQVCSVM